MVTVSSMALYITLMGGPVLFCGHNIKFYILYNIVTCVVLSLLRWSKTSPTERARFMNKIADLVETRLDEFAQAESRDQGKPVWLAKAIDIPRCVHNFRFFASGCQHVIDT